MNTTAETETTLRTTIAALDAPPPDRRRAVAAAWLSDGKAVPGFQALRRRRSRIQGGNLRVILGRHRRDDDDDPPPCPAAAARPVALAGLAAA